MTNPPDPLTATLDVHTDHLTDDTCPVCLRSTQDMRHVDVECFYQVNERAPHLHERKVLRRVPDDALRFGGVLYRAPTLDRRGFTQRTEPSPAGHPVTHLADRWEAADTEPVHLFEVSMYGTRCCKRCRADFIALFLRWSRGQYATPEPAPDEARSIPVRENGALVYLTRAEWDARQAARGQE